MASQPSLKEPDSASGLTVPNGHAGGCTFCPIPTHKVRAEVHSLHSPGSPGPAFPLKLAHSLEPGHPQVQIVGAGTVDTSLTTVPTHEEGQQTVSDEHAQAVIATQDPPADSHGSSYLNHTDQKRAEAEVRLGQGPDPKVAGMSPSHAADPASDLLGEGRLKNRRNGGTSSYYLPTITEDGRSGGGSQTVASNASFSRASSFSGTYSTFGSSSATGGPDAGAGRMNPREVPLTVEGTWKVDSAMKEKQGTNSSRVPLLAVLKWVATLTMAALLLACLVVAKLSVLVLSHLVFSNRPDENPEEKWRPYSAQFIVVYIFLSVPPLVMLPRSVWYGLLDKTVPWPRKRAVLLAVLIAGLESAGLCLMCYSVLGSYEAPVSLLLLAALLLVPAVSSLFAVNSCHRQGRVRYRSVILVGIGAILLLAGAVTAGYAVVQTSDINVDIWHFGAAFLCLSIAWLPSLQRYISPATATTDDKFKMMQNRTAPVFSTFSHNNSNTVDDANLNTVSTANTASSNLHTVSSAYNTASSPESSRRPSASSSESRRKITGDLSSNPAWKAAFVVNGCRVVFIFVFSGLLFMLDSGQGLDNVFTEKTHQAFLDAWNLSAHVEDSTWKAFGLGLGAGFFAYVLAFAACHMNMAKGALVPPLVLTTPLCLVVVTVGSTCDSFLPGDMCDRHEYQVLYVVLAAAFLVLGHVMAFGWYLFRVDPVLLQQESLAFYVPGYNGVSLETWLTINRRHDANVSMTTENKSEKTKVYICTTMYREEEEEMRQLLDSIRLISEAQAAGGQRHFESHIIFDNGVRQKELSEFALTLIALLDETLGLEPKACTKVITPYGLKLSWLLPGPRGQQMAFNIHLKDNLLVKNKKRWSQVMYMSYVLDFLTEGEEDAYILTTDADVVFTPDSVEALLDLMTRDNTIGAVCARTHPMGGGPLVWYQIFEYAIGHWFQKAAEHVLGSVLCAPGCFSVYRCGALADVLPKYAKRVESAFDFLTKDMGEDRWLCTLLVQSGWRIEYCAASENSTNCPSEFDEFYKQRRRWIASTLANLMLIVREWKYVHLLNHRVSVVFLLYQGLLLFSTLIGPSTVMLVVSGGLSFAWDVNGVAPVVVQSLACVAFAALCLFTTQPTQLKVAKVYTFLYAVVMTAVVVGTAEQIVSDLSANEDASSSPPAKNETDPTTPPPIPKQHISVDLPMSVTTLYFSILVGIFLMAGLLHPREIYCLLHGVWYLLCLPSGYLVLIIYSICNITDSSWGTREQSAEKSAVKNAPWQQRLQELFFEIFFCCARPSRTISTAENGVQTVMPRSSSVSVTDDPPPTPMVHDDVSATSAIIDIEPPQDQIDEVPDETEPIPVEDWLPLEMRPRYAPLFKKHGFDNTLFIAGMTETELRRIGVTSQGHLHFLLAQVTLIPAFEIEYKVPTNVDVWLEEIGLPMYRDNFRSNHIRHPKEMEILKCFGRREIERELRIIKDGHIKRLRYAISKLRDPTEAQQKAMRMRQEIEDAPVHYLGESNVGENAFWENLKEKCLQPDLKAFGLEGEVKLKLANLRQDWLMILAVSNTLWLILITTLASATDLTVLGANPMGLVFLVVFGFLFFLQFLTMLWHRLSTVSHYLARAPYRCGVRMSPLGASAAPRRQDFEESEDWAAMVQVKRDEKRAWKRVLSTKRKTRRHRDSPATAEQLSETSPLLDPRT